LSGAAERTIDAEGRAVAPGFIDNHCHYDAQVTWDPRCTFSPEHGASTVIFGSCSLSLAPVRKGTEERLAEFLSYVEAIPMEVLRTSRSTGRPSANTWTVSTGASAARRTAGRYLPLISDHQLW
jgi:N-acyl-D-aspartate/D-glutamate deacylase